MKFDKNESKTPLLFADEDEENCVAASTEASSLEECGQQQVRCPITRAMRIVGIKSCSKGCVRPKPCTFKWCSAFKTLGLFVLCFYAGRLIAFLAIMSFEHIFPNWYSHTSANLCPQAEPLIPSFNLNLTLDRFKDETYRGAAAERFAGALRINTVSFDNMRGPPPEGDDPLHAGFPILHEYLKNQFPLVHAHLDRHIVGKYSLLYVWKGSDAETNDALMLCAHQDTVPVGETTLDEWKHAPWSGDIADGWVWGRGAADTKGTLMGAIEAVEMLIKGGFWPKQTVLLAFGHDEEISGIQGAQAINDYITNELGLAGKIGMLVDEGFSFVNVYDIEVAGVATAEKGYVDIDVTVETKGGHASIPPPHTGIGILSEFIVKLEANTYPVALSDANPFLNFLQCTAQHSPTISPVIRWAVENLDYGGRKYLENALSQDPQQKYMIATSQAVDVVKGGAKVNALPESAHATINQRVTVDSRVAEVEAKVTKDAMALAQARNYNLTITNQGTSLVQLHGTADALGNINVDTWVGALEPSPISPVGDAAWNVLAGSILHALPNKKEQKLIVSPMLMPGNTDTRHYWGLTRNIYRFSPAREGEGIHTVNERITVDSYVDTVIFFHELVRNWDEK